MDFFAFGTVPVLPFGHLDTTFDFGFGPNQVFGFVSELLVEDLLDTVVGREAIVVFLLAFVTVVDFPPSQVGQFQSAATGRATTKIRSNERLEIHC